MPVAGIERGACVAPVQPVHTADTTTHLSKSVTKTFEFPQKNGLYGLNALFNSFKTRYEPKYLVEGFTRNGVLNFFSKIYHFSSFFQHFTIVLIEKMSSTVSTKDL